MSEPQRRKTWRRIGPGLYVREPNGVIYAKFRVLKHDFFRSTRCKTKENAKDERKQMIAAEERRLLGLPTLDKAAREKPLDLLKKFMKEKERLGRGEKHRETLEHRLEVMLAGASSIVEVTPDYVSAALALVAATEVKARPKNEDGSKPKVSPQTVNAYRRDLDAFFRWLKKTKQWADNPVEAVEPLPPGDPTMVYRSFTPVEKRLFFDRTPLERLAAYVLSASSGLRKGEMSRLIVEDLTLDPAEDGTPFARMKRSATKNKKAVLVPLHPEAVVLLRRLVHEKKPSDAVFDSLPTCARFNRDIKAAGIERVTREGRLTFTSLRKALATDLDRTGAPEGLIVKVMRQSDPRLTRGTYTQYELEAKANAVGKLSFVSPERRAALGLSADGETPTEGDCSTPSSTLEGTPSKAEGTNDLIEVGGRLANPSSPGSNPGAALKLRPAWATVGRDVTHPEE